MPADPDPAPGVALVRAENPGPKTLEGTNSWVLAVEGRAWVVDPGPDQDRHLDALAEAVEGRGGLAGIALTHGHGDHADGVAGLLERCGPAPVLSHAGRVPAGAAAGTVAVPVADGERHGPFRVLGTPGHARDHVAFLHGALGFVGDTVLGRGSVLLVPHEGALDGYLRALRRLRSERLGWLLPGHGPVIDDPRAKLDEYIAHRLDRERRLIAALGSGARSVDDLLDAAWDDAPGNLRLAAAVTLQAHLDKLADEGRLPRDVERPDFGDFDGL